MVGEWVRCERLAMVRDLRRLRGVLVGCLAKVLAGGEDRQLAEDLAHEIARTIVLASSLTPAVGHS